MKEAIFVGQSLGGAGKSSLAIFLAEMHRPQAEIVVVPVAGDKNRAGAGAFALAHALKRTQS
ncbi:MAG: hypothetical protein HQL37_09225 [Alphaproteobacteria bacterium]|nr:hypothetical protein [Alphaproteobacteria bacterium]